MSSKSGQTGENPDESQHSILLVEGNEDDEALSLKAVKNSGVRCEVAILRTGTGAINALLLQETPIPELIILEFHLPHYNGMEILRELRKHKRFRDVPIVMFSSLESKKDVSQYLQRGANSVVQKPNNPSAYVETVGQMVRYWLTIHQNSSLPLPENQSEGLDPTSSPIPKVHIIKLALINAQDRKFASKSS